MPLAAWKVTGPPARRGTLPRRRWHLLPQAKQVAACWGHLLLLLLRWRARPHCGRWAHCACAGLVAAASAAGLWAARRGPGSYTGRSGQPPPAKRAKGRKRDNISCSLLQAAQTLDGLACRPKLRCASVRQAPCRMPPTCGHSSGTFGSRMSPRRGRSPAGGAWGNLAAGREQAFIWRTCIQ